MGQSRWTCEWQILGTGPTKVVLSTAVPYENGQAPDTGAALVVGTTLLDMGGMLDGLVVEAEAAGELILALSQKKLPFEPSCTPAEIGDTHHEANPRIPRMLPPRRFTDYGYFYHKLSSHTVRRR